MKIFTSRARLCGLAAAFSIIFPAASQTSSPVTQLKDVVVSSSLTEQRVHDALPSTTLISRADIERAQAFDLATLLRTVAGVQMAQNGGTGKLASAFIRGAEARHTLVLVDGVAINNLNFSLASLEHIALSNVERIEVVRGNVSSLYGSAALGGVIQIFTREAGRDSFANLSMQAGSGGLVQVQAGAGIKIGTGTRLSISAESLTDRGFNAIDQGKRAGTNPDIDGYSRRTISLGLSQDIGIGKVSFSANESTGTAAYDSEFGPASQVDESSFTLRSASLSGKFRLGKGVELDTTLSSGIDKLKADVTAFPYFVSSFSDSANVSMRWQFAPGNTVTAGLDTTRQRIESDTVYNASSRQLNSARLGYVGDFQRHEVQVNVRQDRYSDFGTAATWLAAYGYKLTDAWRFNVSASTGFSAPTFNDLYFPFGGNPNLRPEQLQSAELGVRYVGDVNQMRAVLFSNRFTDLIGNDANFDRVNISQARNQGLEMSYQGSWGATRVMAGLTLQDPVDLTTLSRLMRRAAVLGNIGVTRDAGAWSAGANLRYSGERPDGTNTLAAYSVLDLTLSHALSREVKLFGRIDNLLDARYETVYGYQQAGFGVFAGVNWQPKF